jgi:hypothetical protein
VKPLRLKIAFAASLRRKARNEAELAAAVVVAATGYEIGACEDSGNRSTMRTWGSTAASVA